MSPTGLNLDRLKLLMREAGATQLYLKRLADNDNSKNQIYLGPDFTALNILPNGPLAASSDKPALFKSPLKFSWLTDAGNLIPAPGAQLILYPQYPEVRLSGFLKGTTGGPNNVMTIRQRGRIMFFGITATGHILGFAAAHDSALALEIDELRLEPDNGVFSRITLEVRTDDRKLLLRELSRIAALGWIDSRRLNSKGELLACNAPNCGGYTLEAELGIRPNGIAAPDFHGWEIKQHAVPRLVQPAGGGPITLMTPEPTGGVYVEDGIQEFIRRYGYADRFITDRRNFGGIHSTVRVCAATKLKLTLDGYDTASSRITDASKGISLFDPSGETAAVWHYKDLLSHWTRKHALAAYVPSINRKSPANQYHYGNLVRLGEGTEFRLFLDAVASGAVYYDPGIKIVGAAGTRQVIKRRSQFRIKSSSIPLLYMRMTEVDVSTVR
jgi:hypothetical protein